MATNVGLATPCYVLLNAQPMRTDTISRRIHPRVIALGYLRDLAPGAQPNVTVGLVCYSQSIWRALFAQEDAVTHP